MAGKGVVGTDGTPWAEEEVGEGGIMGALMVFPFIIPRVFSARIKGVYNLHPLNGCNNTFFFPYGFEPNDLFTQ